MEIICFLDYYCSVYFDINVNIFLGNILMCGRYFFRLHF